MIHDLGLLRAAYNRGENITEMLQDRGVNSVEAVQVAYDLQAGTYVDSVFMDREFWTKYCAEVGNVLSKHVGSLDAVIDCGTGELTTLSGVSHYLPGDIEFFAFDISLSRIRVGLKFAQVAMRSTHFSKLKTFVGQIGAIPLPSKSMDVVFSVHALEPNYGREESLLKELFRVARKKVILFEPSWENTTSEGRARMERLGYVRNLPDHIKACGGVLLECFPLTNVGVQLNRTYCYVIEASPGSGARFVETPFSCPISGEILEQHSGYLWSQAGGYAFPVIDGIPVLVDKYGVLMCLR